MNIRELEEDVQCGRERLLDGEPMSPFVEEGLAMIVVFGEDDLSSQSFHL